MPVFLRPESPFPDPRTADPSGLVAVGGDLSVERLLTAYRSGIFPWSADPITWWSPDPRGILELNHFHVSRSLARVLKHCVVGEPSPADDAVTFAVTFDRAFRPVMEQCATARTDGNWISGPFIDAYTRLHQAGHAHSVECWQKGELVGGVYGVAVGGLFAGESMFHRVSNASKVALYFLVERLKQRGFILFDVQMVTPTTEKLGAIQIPREQYLERLREAAAMPERMNLKAAV